MSDLIRLPNGDAFAGEDVIGIEAYKYGQPDAVPIWEVQVDLRGSKMMCSVVSGEETAIAERDRIIGLVDAARREERIYQEKMAQPTIIGFDRGHIPIGVPEFLKKHAPHAGAVPPEWLEGGPMPRSSDPEAYAEMTKNIPYAPGSVAAERYKLAKTWLCAELEYIELSRECAVPDHIVDKANLAMLDLKEAFAADPAPIQVGGYWVYPNEKGVPKYRVAEGGYS